MKDLIQKMYSPDDPPVGGAPSADPIPDDFEPAPEFSWEPPKQEEPPAWAQALYAKMDALAAQSAPVQDDSWRYDNESLKLSIQQEMEALKHQMASQLADLTAPMIRNEVITQVGQGLNDAGKEFIRKQIAQLSPFQLKNIVSTPASVELLRNAAENAHNKAAKTPMPKSEPVGNPRSGTKPALNADMEKEKRRLMHTFKLTEDEATAAIQEALESRR